MRIHELPQASGFTLRRHLAAVCRAFVAFSLLVGFLADARAVQPRPAGAECKVRIGNGLWSEFRSTCREALETMSRYYIYARPPNPRVYCDISYPQRSPCGTESNQGWYPYSPEFYGVADLQYSEASCPANSAITSGGDCKCKSGYQDDPSGTFCASAPPEPTAHEPAACLRPVSGVSTSNPILPATAEKHRSETDFADGSFAGLTFSRIYRSSWGSDNSRVAGSLGKAWSHNHITVLSASPTTNPNSVWITSAEGYLRTFFNASGTATWTATNSADLLNQNGDGTWTYRRADDDAVLSFTADG